MLDKLKSTKVIMAGVTFAIFVANDVMNLALDESTQDNIVKVAMAFFGGQGLGDIGKALATRNGK